ncbi:glycosyltransferase 87 family protein [Streptomyces sp. NRRL S-920]|uniref:glycosyltransferase 87 family protein n=1 Tax=Streptomyces sp. NRRL S-920 TaxID=1463921 RepID=UPI000B2E37FB
MNPRTATTLSLSALTTSLTSLLVLCLLQRVPMADALVYRAEGEAVVRGADLYGFTVTEWELPATYPPFAALLFVPTVWLPLPALKVVFLLGNTALVALLLHLSCRLTGLRPRPRHLCAATALALWLEPVFQTVVFGQINLVLACLVLWDLTRSKGVVGKGVGVGVAAGVKLTPVLFIAYLFLVGRVREAVTALAAFAGTVLFGALVLPSATVEFWTRRVFETGRVGKAWIVDNQSLQGLIARALHDAQPGLAWALPAALTAAAGLWLMRRAPAYGPAGVLLAALTTLLICPISWSHHWVWCVPLLAFLIAEGRARLAVAVAVLFTARTFWVLPHQGDLDLGLPWWQQPLASPYPLLALALLPLLAGTPLLSTSMRLSTSMSTRTEVPSPRAGVDWPHGRSTAEHGDRDRRRTGAGRDRRGVPRRVGRP